MNRFVTLEVASERLHIAAFASEIQFTQQRATKLASRRFRLVIPGLRHVLFQQLRQLSEQFQVDANGFLDARVLDLQDDLLSVSQFRAMHLTDRCGRKCLRFKLGKQVLRGLAQFFDDRLPHNVRRVGWRVGLKLSQFRRDIRPDQVGSCAEDLPQFDIGRPQFRQSQPQSFADGQVRNCLRFLARQQITNRLHWNLGEPICQSIATQHLDDFRQTLAFFAMLIQVQ